MAVFTAPNSINYCFINILEKINSALTLAEKK